MFVGAAKALLTSDGIVRSLVTVYHVCLWPDFHSHDYLLASWVVICTTSSVSYIHVDSDISPSVPVITLYLL